MGSLEQALQATLVLPSTWALSFFRFIIKGSRIGSQMEGGDKGEGDTVVLSTVLLLQNNERDDSPSRLYFPRNLPIPLSARCDPAQ